MDKKPTIRIPAQKKQEGVKNLKYDQIFLEQFIYLVVGKPGSGKSRLIEEMILNPDFYYKKFNDVIFISPSKFINLKLDEDNHNTELDLKWLKDKLDQLKQLYEKTNQYKNVLIVFDDVISQMQDKCREQFLVDLFYNRRHLIQNTTISILITTQKFTMCPARFRSVVDGIFLFKLGKAEWKQVEQAALFIDKNSSKEIFTKAYTNPYGNIFIKVNPYEIYINFEKYENL